MFGCDGENEKVYIFTYQIINADQLFSNNDYHGLLVSN